LDLDDEEPAASKEKSLKWRPQVVSLGLRFATNHAGNHWVQLVAGWLELAMLWAYQLEQLATV